VFLWLFYLLIGFIVVRFLWRAYVHPAHTLGRQAANMNWVATGRMEADGVRNVCVGRDGMEALISYKFGNVRLLKPLHDKPFKDFVELERWLATSKRKAPANLSDGGLAAERMYLESVEEFIRSVGFYDRLLALQAGDKAFFVASMNLMRAGFRADQSEKVIGAFVMETVHEGERDLEKAVLMLQFLERKYSQAANVKS
jgi:hypothetical protein